MKSTSVIIALVISLAAARALASDDIKAKSDKDSKAVSAAKAKKIQAQSASHEKKILVTGSYIRQSVRKNERITDGVNPVVVLDHDTIQRTGAADLRQLLVRQGTH